MQNGDPHPQELVNSTYFYGDSTPSALQMNYIEFLRDTVAFCVQILVAEARILEGRERAHSLRQWAADEIARIEEVEATVARSLAPLAPTADSSVGRCVEAVLRSASGAVRQEAENVRSQAAAQIGRMEGETSSEAATCLGALEVLLEKHDLPGATSGQSLVLQDDGRYRCRLHMTSSIGLAAELAVEVPPDQPFGQPVRLDRFFDRLEVVAPEVGGWLQRELKVRPQRLEKLFVTELRIGTEETTLSLRNAPRSKGQGFDLIFRERGPAARMTTVTERGQASATAYDAAGKDLAALISLRDKLRDSARTLQKEKRKLVLATFEEAPIGPPERLPLLVQRLVAWMAPVVQEIAARSLSPDELVLRRQLGEDRREEIFLSKADLLHKIEILPEDRRALFDPLWLDPSRARRSYLMPPTASAISPRSDGSAQDEDRTPPADGSAVDGDDRERGLTAGLLDSAELARWLGEPTQP